MATRTTTAILRPAFVAGLAWLVWWAWVLPYGGQLAPVGAVVAVLAACGSLAGARHLALYALGAAVLLVALVVGVAYGPLSDASATGFCTSAFSPELPPDDTPRRVAERCAEARRQHGIVVGVLGVVGTAVMLSALRPPRTGPARHAA